MAHGKGQPESTVRSGTLKKSSPPDLKPLTDRLTNRAGREAWQEPHGSGVTRPTGEGMDLNSERGEPISIVRIPPAAAGNTHSRLPMTGIRGIDDGDDQTIGDLLISTSTSTGEENSDQSAVGNERPWARESRYAGGSSGRAYETDFDEYVSLWARKIFRRDCRRNGTLHGGKLTKQRWRIIIHLSRRP